MPTLTLPIDALPWAAARQRRPLAAHCLIAGIGLGMILFGVVV